MNTELLNTYDANESAAILCHSNPTSSFGRMALDIKKILSPKHKCEILWLVKTEFLSSIPPQSHVIHTLNLKLAYWSFRRPLQRWLKKMQPQKILLISPLTSFLIPTIRKTLPNAWIGVLIHDMFTETMIAGSLKLWLLNKLYTKRAKTADGFLYNSDYTRTEANRIGGYPLNHPIIGCPIDTSVFAAGHSDKGSLRQKWGLDRYKMICLNVSIDDQRKNIETYFKLAEERQDIAFVRIGQLSERIKKLLDDNQIKNVIHFSGLSIDAVVELYHCSDLFIFPSFLEGFGMPPLEALACGIPTVAADTSALRENLSGIVPLVDPPDNINGYLKVIDDVMAGKNVVDWNAANKLLERFTLENFGERVRSCFKNASSPLSSPKAE